MKFGLGADVVVGSAVVDMYWKCGEMDDALRAFQEMPFHFMEWNCKSVWSEWCWNEGLEALQ